MSLNDERDRTAAADEAAACCPKHLVGMNYIDDERKMNYDKSDIERSKEV